MHLNSTISTDKPALGLRELFMMTWIQNLLGFFYDIVFGCRHWSHGGLFARRANKSNAAA